MVVSWWIVFFCAVYSVYCVLLYATKTLCGRDCVIQDVFIGKAVRRIYISIYAGVEIVFWLTCPSGKNLLACLKTNFPNFTPKVYAKFSNLSFVYLWELCMICIIVQSINQ